MDQVIVHKFNGEAIKSFSFSKVSGITQAEQVCDLSGQDVVNMSIVSAEPLSFELRDYIDVFGRIYTLNILPEVRKVNDRRFEYEIQFEGPQYDLIKVQYLDLDSTGYSTGSTFNLMGNAKTFSNLLIANLERFYGPGQWVIGEVIPNTEFLNMSFQNETCLQVLQKIIDTYQTKFDIERLPFNKYRLNIRTPNNLLEDVFIYGRGRGLYGLSRTKANDKNIVTRLYAYGSTKNIPLNYRSGFTRLKMPIGSIFSEGQPYIEDPVAIAKYGLIEGSIVYDNIFPNRTGIVTAVNAANSLEFYDSTMSFNLTEVVNGTSTYLISGMAPKIVFKSGNLSGYEFNLNSNSPYSGYDHNSKKFTIIPYTDDSGLVFPSATDPAFQIHGGDQYTIVDIALPQSYIDEAENSLEITAGQYLYDNSKPRVQYGLTIDENYIAGMAPNQTTIINYFTVGDLIKIRDESLQIDGRSQIQSLKRNVLKHYQYDLTLGDEEVNPTSRKYRTKRQKLLEALRNGTGQSLSANQAAQVQFITNTSINQFSQTVSNSGIFTREW